MTTFEVSEPILNSPFEEPREYWQIEPGAAPAKIAGRRLAGYFYRDPRGSASNGDGAAKGEWQELELVNVVRKRLASWREAGHPGASRTTLALIRHWRRDGRQRRLFY